MMKVWLKTGSNGRCHVIMYAHGSCVSNGNDQYAAAGAAYFFGFDNEQNGTCRVGGRQTSQRAQLTAVLEGLKIILANTKIDCVIVRTNSNYVADAMTDWIHAWERNGWRTAKGKAVENQDLIKPLRALCQKFGNIDWEILDADSDDEHYLETVDMSMAEAQERAD